jgi:transposase InsO family protein
MAPRRVHAELRLGHGILVGHGAVELLMRRAGLAGLPGRKRRRPVHETAFAGDLVDRNFARPAPNQLWVTDITEHPTREGKIYCAVVLDVHSRRVVGWSIDSSQTAALATNALSMAIGNRSPLPPGTVIHSDHGVQFTSWAFTRRAKESGLVPSMGSIGDCYDTRRHRVLPGPRTDRTAQPTPLAHPHRACQRPVRVPRDLPQPPPPTQRPGHAHTDRVREAPHPSHRVNPAT